MFATCEIFNHLGYSINKHDIKFYDVINDSIMVESVKKKENHKED